MAAQEEEKNAHTSSLHKVGGVRILSGGAQQSLNICQETINLMASRWPPSYNSNKKSADGRIKKKELREKFEL
jgi:hypothetical protein